MALHSAYISHRAFEVSYENLIATEKFYILLGNLAIEGVAYRDAILNLSSDFFDCVNLDLSLFNLGIAEKILWLFSILMKEEPSPSKKDVSKTLQ